MHVIQPEPIGLERSYRRCRQAVPIRAIHICRPSRKLVLGNHVLPQTTVEATVYPFLGANRDLDTGKPVSPGEYLLTDRSYDKLLVKLAGKKFDSVTPGLRENILSFYAQMKTPDPHGINVQLAALKAFVPSGH